MANTTLLQNELIRSGISFTENERLSAYTTIGIGGCADLLIRPTCAVELVKAVELLRELDVKGLLLGKGSNLLVSDAGLRGAAVYTGGLRDIYVERIAGEDVFIRAFCGCKASSLVAFCKVNSLTGLEFLCGIPGTVGGCVVMNAGCYGKNIGDRVVSVFALNGGRLTLFNREQCCFGYRESTFQNSGSVVISALFRTKIGDKAQILQNISAYNGLRHAQPKGKSMGSVFRNGELPSGKLIEDCGLKGLRIGDAHVSMDHANFIVNDGYATASDVYGLIKIIKSTVLKKTGVALKEEIKYVGEFR